jgi:gas vesicle protein GvpG
MGLFAGLLGLPLAPVRGVIWLAEQLEAEAARQQTDPGAVRRQLEDLDEARQSGEISAEECAQLQEELVWQLLAARGGGWEGNDDVR